MGSGSVADGGATRIVDRAGHARLPLGCERFEDLLREHVFVDKSLAIRTLMERRGTTILCRPPRFGKSTFVRMLQSFFETPVEGYTHDSSDLFDALAIAADDPRYMVERGTHPVILIDLANCEARTFEHALDRIAHKMSAEYRRHRYLLDEGTLWDGEVARFRRLMEGHARPVELECSLAWLSMLLARHHRTKTVILIDNYDTPAVGAHLGGFSEQMLDFLCPWLTSALKDTTDLYCAVLTGVLRLCLYSPTGGLDNAQIDTTLDDDYAEAFDSRPRRSRSWLPTWDVRTGSARWPRSAVAIASGKGTSTAPGRSSTS